jgi:hypothetical protein
MDELMHSTVESKPALEPKPAQCSVRKGKKKGVKKAGREESIHTHARVRVCVRAHTCTHTHARIYADEHTLTLSLLSPSNTNNRPSIPEYKSREQAVVGLF